MKGQQYLQFDKRTTAIVTGDWESGNEMVVPMFRELDEEEIKKFRTHARENYVVGTPIEPLFHPIWQAEAQAMNEEAGIE